MECLRNLPAARGNPEMDLQSHSEREVAGGRLGGGVRNGIIDFCECFFSYIILNELD